MSKKGFAQRDWTEPKPQKDELGYTKGEWGAYDRTVISVGGVRLQNGQVIAICYSENMPLEEAQSNTHLISVAPEIYEALKRILDDRNSALAREAGRRALAKAEGK